MTINPKRMIKFLKSIKRINLKSIYINFHYFPFSTAIKIPILVSKHTFLKQLKGEIILKHRPDFGLIKIGFGDIGIFDKSRSRTILEIKGRITFTGKTHIGHGSKISVWEGADLIFGDNFEISAESTIVATNKIQFGKNILISWNVLIMDSDLHSIYSEGILQNPPQPIKIGDNVWIGCNSTLLKGTIVGDNVVIGANSLLSRNYPINNVILAGNPAIRIKALTNWTV